MTNESTIYHSAFNKDRLVHIVDNDTATCETLSLLFRLEGFRTTFSTDASQFLVSGERTPPDVAILNLRLNGGSGLPLLRRIKAMRTGIPVFMLADEPSVDAAVMAMKLGASDVISKPIDKELLLSVVRDALRRDIHVGAMQEGRRIVEVRGFSQLTPRERDVLQLITNGCSNKDAARELAISPRTVEVHRARVMEKLGARSATDLMRIVLTS